MIVCSIIIPVRNEVNGLPALVHELRHLQNVFSEQGITTEFIVSDNGSDDGSFDAFCSMVGSLKHVRVFQLLRNYGYQESLLFAMSRCQGDVVCILQSDLQDPPELLPEFVSRWKAGHRTVAGRPVRRAESYLMTLVRRFFYGLMGMMSSGQNQSGIQDFYLLDRLVVLDILQSKPSEQLIRTYVGEQFGFDFVIDYERRPRQTDTPTLKLGDYYDLALDGFLTSSARGIRTLTLSSFGLATLSLSSALVLVVLYLLGWRPNLVGWLSLAVLLVTFLGLAGFAFGLTLEFLYRLLRRPTPLRNPVVQREFSLTETDISQGFNPGAGHEGR